MSKTGRSRHVFCTELWDTCSAVSFVSGNTKFNMADGGKEGTEFSDLNENQQETDDEKLERQYFWKVIEAFLYYK